jgi:molybdopterin converting factor subunit 1
MRVRTLFFATYRELAGTEELEIELPVGATAGDLVARLRSRGALARLPVEPALAVNQEYAPLGTRLSDGDEVALLPPVAGG